MSWLMQLKSINLKLKQKQAAKELSCSGSTTETIKRRYKLEQPKSIFLLKTDYNGGPSGTHRDSKRSQKTQTSHTLKKHPNEEQS